MSPCSASVEQVDVRTSPSQDDVEDLSLSRDKVRVSVSQLELGCILPPSPFGYPNSTLRLAPYSFVTAK